MNIRSLWRPVSLRTFSTINVFTFANEPHYFIVSCFYKHTPSVSLSPLLKCVWVCTCFCESVFVCVLVCMHVEADMFSVTVHLIFETRSLAESGAQDSLDLQARKPQRSSCLSPQCCSYNVTLHPEFYMGSEHEPRSSCLYCKYLMDWTISPTPSS